MSNGMKVKYILFCQKFNFWQKISGKNFWQKISGKNFWQKIKFLTKINFWRFKIGNFLEQTPEFTWHGDQSIATYETCCGEPYSSSFHGTDDTNRSAAMMFDDSIWTSWKSYQPGNPQYSVTVQFNRPIVFRELRVVPNPVPFGIWWYNKQLQGVCVYVDEVQVDCTDADFELPAEPQEFDYNGKKDSAFIADHARWEALRDQFYLSFTTDDPAGITGKTVKIVTKMGQEASYGDLKVLYDGSGIQSYRLIQPEPDH